MDEASGVGRSLAHVVVSRSAVGWRGGVLPKWPFGLDDT